MARPRKAETQQAATVRIENAFWKLLEKERFADITVRLISQESGTNRNSFYYHYADIFDLASKAFSNNTDDEVTQILISALLADLNGEAPDEGAAFDSGFLTHSKRIMLCARSDSAYLKELVGDMLKRVWFDAFSIKEELLTEAENLEVNFIFAGLVSVLGSKEVGDSPLKMYGLAKTELGKAIVAELKKIAASQELIEKM